MSWILTSRCESWTSGSVCLVSPIYSHPPLCTRYSLQGNHYVCLLIALYIISINICICRQLSILSKIWIDTSASSSIHYCMDYQFCNVLLDIYPKENFSIWAKTWTQAFTAALFIMTQTWKLPKYPSGSKWIMKYGTSIQWDVIQH